MSERGRRRREKKQAVRGNTEREGGRSEKEKGRG